MDDSVSIATAHPLAAFLDRAQAEAARYGSDPWVFIRELLQNARDAGATKIDITTLTTPDGDEVVCADNGEGMTFDHARRYLFALYRSSKDFESTQVGKFGVGFWSILRFAPTIIEVSSRPKEGSCWGLRLSNSLATTNEIPPPEHFGTVIRLARTESDPALQRRVVDAVSQSGRYLHQRDHVDQPVLIAVNGHPVNATFTLPAPSIAFSGKGYKGVVGLGPAARVELFSGGLRVRSASCLDDLLGTSPRHSSHLRVRFLELARGIAPQAILESGRLQVLLSRADARSNRALVRLVRRAQRELQRLVEHHLVAARPLPWWHPWSFLGETNAVRRWWIAAAVLAGTATSITYAMRSQEADEVRSSTTASATEAASGSTVASRSSSDEPPGIGPLRDFAGRYRGPQVDGTLRHAREAIDLRYTPRSQHLYFSILTLADLGRDGTPTVPPDTVPDIYVGTPCSHNCTFVELTAEVGPEGLRLPSPTGHRIDSASVTFDGSEIAIEATAAGHAMVSSPTRRIGHVTFRTSSVADPSRWRVDHAEFDLPADLDRLARRLRRLPISDRVKLARSEVQRSVRYDISQQTAQLHRQASEQGQGFIDRTLDVGAGDCDVQNGLLVALLQAADVPARLAIGYVGDDGATSPILHAWAEYRTEDRRWHVADASTALGSAVLSELSSDGQTSAPTADTANPSTPDPIAAPQEPATPAQQPLGQTTPARVRPHLNTRFARFVHGPLFSRAGYLLLILIGGFVSAMFVRALARGTRSLLKLDKTPELAPLIQGFLQHPGSFGSVAGLFHRPLIPTLGGAYVSVSQARKLAHRRRLYRATSTDSSLVQAAVNHGCRVVDDGHDEGRVVADAFGAQDLDRWQRLLDATRTDQTLERMNTVLRQSDQTWEVRYATGTGVVPEVIELAKLGYSWEGSDVSVLVCLDPEDPVVVTGQQVDDPQGAPPLNSLRLLDHLIRAVELPPRRRSLLLAALARDLVMEHVAS